MTKAGSVASRQADARLARHKPRTRAGVLTADTRGNEAGRHSTLPIYFVLRCVNAKCETKGWYKLAEQKP